MDPSAIKAMMAEVAPVIRDYVASATAPLIERNAALDAENKALASRIEALEARELPEAIKGDPGEVDMVEVERKLSDLVTAAFATIPVPQDGKSVDPAEIKAMVDDAVAALPAPKDGADCDMEAVDALIAEKVATAVSALPVPEKGDPGEVDMEAVAALIDKAVAALPVPQNGKDCDMAEVERMIGEKIAALPPAKDGVGLASAFKDSDGCLILTMTNGETRNLGPIDGKDGETFTLDDFDIEPLDERTIKMKFTRGEVCHSFELAFPVPIYRGVFREGETYAKADMVTWAGSVWIAETETADKPGVKDWVLAAKKGRDGKDARP